MSTFINTQLESESELDFESDKEPWPELECDTG